MPVLSEDCLSEQLEDNCLWDNWLLTQIHLENGHAIKMEVMVFIY